VGAFVVRVVTLDDGIVTERRGGADDVEGGGHRAWFGVVLVQKACRRREERILVIWKQFIGSYVILIIYFLTNHCEPW